MSCIVVMGCGPQSQDEQSQNTLTISNIDTPRSFLVAGHTSGDYRIDLVAEGIDWSASLDRMKAEFIVIDDNGREHLVLKMSGDSVEISEELEGIGVSVSRAK